MLPLFEALVRGILVGILLLSAYHLARHLPRSICSLSGTAFMVCFSAYITISMPGVLTMLGPPAVMFISLATMAPVFFWWFVLALVDDRFKLGLLHWAVATLMIAIIAIRQLPFGISSDVIEMIRVLTLVAMFPHAIWAAHKSLTDDLVPARRAFSRAFSILAPIFGICIALVEGWAVFNPLPSGINFVQLGALLIIVTFFSGWLTSLRGDLLPAVSRTALRGSPVKPVPDPTTDRLMALMNDGAYKTPGLTIGGLADLMKMPEHRLRRLINDTLGHRNFSSFLNDFRIDEAKRLLADPNLADQQITAIAFDLGFSSLAPFNRAFRERTGVSPRDYRHEIERQN